MKFVFAFLCVAVLGALAHHLPDSEKQKLKEVHDSCQSDPATYANEDELRRLSDNVDNKQVGIHMFCMSVKAGLQHPDGEFDRELIRSKVALVTHDQSKVDGLVDKCVVKKETREKTAVLLWLCFVNNEVHYYHKL